jgi:circadian clock protein KaiC
LHGTNEFPFLIGSQGVSVLPITSIGLQHAAPLERVSSGVPGLDDMLGGEGFYRGSSVLVSGTAGTGKSSIAAQFCAAACARGERAIYFGFEESSAQIIRNMHSVNIDLTHWVDEGLLRFRCVRPSLLGLEAHLVSMQELVSEFAPQVAVLDPISDMLNLSDGEEVFETLTRQVDYLKSSGVTAVFTSLNVIRGSENADQHLGLHASTVGLIDTWVVAKLEEEHGSRQRVLSILKSRGTAHSQEVRSFDISRNGLRVTDVVHEEAVAR